ncbi:MAG: hypothetical protein E6Q96_09255 [Cyclobacteriaceae bacterium]|nr:MAG: hypothetical protein E6Q96_09255 [Cyclobacteriaceae bacterium]
MNNVITFSRLLGLLIFSILGIYQATAQTFAIPQTHKINTPYGPAKFTTYTYQRMPMMNYSQQGPVSRKYQFYLVMKDGGSLVTKNRINFEDSINSIALKDESKRVIKPNETVEIFRMLPEGIKFIGIPTDSCWLFKSSTGKINTYSMLAEQDMSYAVAIQKGTGDIVKLSKENLLELTADANDAELVAMIEKKKFLKAIQRYNREK